MNKLTVALAKGRLAKGGVHLLKKAGYQIPDDIFTSRKLIFQAGRGELELILVKPGDVPIYVEYGTADIGVVGKDTLLETAASLYEVLDLEFGKCKFILAGLPDFDRDMTHYRVATKYPGVAKDYFQKKGQPVEIIKLTGSIELAPLTGLADLIVDIMETGRTLRENGLVVFEEMHPLSARLVVNRVSMKTKRDKVNSLIENIKCEIEESGSNVEST